MTNKETNIKLIKNNNVNSYLKMKTTTMTVISTTMTTTGAAMTAAFGDSDVVCKLCIRSALNINEKLH